MALVKLPSGEIRLIHQTCLATIGQVGNLDHENVSVGKAGRSRWKGIRPTVRGTAMNPVDHPMGGGEGRGKGSENYGGAVVTAGGLLFIAATPDAKIRAFDKTTGEEVWQADLPAAGFATPSTYSVNGRQFVVVAAGGGKLGAPSGTKYVAFALPEAE